jgi:hypothetical protein
MTEETKEEIMEETVDPKVEELTLLKERATLMGVTFHPNIGADKLKEKIAAKQAPPKAPEYADEQADTILAAEAIGRANTFTPGVRETPMQLKTKRKQEALKLVRVRVTCMNPNKSNIPGEIHSVGNGELGMIKKYIPFNADQGWHIPNILLQSLKSKKYMSHYEIKIGNKRIKKHRLVPEYAIEIMPALTGTELNELKQRQIIASAGQE